MLQCRCAGVTARGERCKITACSSLRDDRCGSILAGELLRAGGKFCSFHASLFETCVFDIGNTRSHVFFIDLETTGLDMMRSYIVELAAVDLESNAIFSTIIRPPKGIPAEEQGIHGITAEEINEGVDFKTAFDRFLSFVATMNKRRARGASEPCETILAAHNGKRFDFPLLVRECIEYDISIGVMDGFKFVDTLQVMSARKNVTEAPKCRKLQCLAMTTSQYAFGRERIQAHRALDDCLILKQVCSDLAYELDTTPIRLVALFSERLECDSTSKIWTVLRQSAAGAHGGDDRTSEALARSLRSNSLLATRVMEAIVRREMNGCAIPSTPKRTRMNVMRDDAATYASPRKERRMG